MKNNMRIQLVPNLKLEQKQKYNSTQEKYLKIFVCDFFFAFVCYLMLNFLLFIPFLPSS